MIIFKIIIFAILVGVAAGAILALLDGEDDEIIEAYKEEDNSNYLDWDD